jgi:hypothetical protein
MNRSEPLWLSQMAKKNGRSTIIVKGGGGRRPGWRYFAADRLAQMNDESAVDPLLLVLNDANLAPWMASYCSLGPENATRHKGALGFREASNC